ncbi:HD domain-containing protein [Vagococcus fluvialis]|uniref:HD domain-containing protein n=2 Tax=Vagococcus fluvialis TaxID=2738 RepID=UPI0032E48781
MKPREILKILSVAEKLKDTTRHCYTSKGRHESVAEHSWMMTFFAFLLEDEFLDLDINKVIKMCIIHDLGEVFTGDIPTFEKNKEHEKLEEDLLYQWIISLPEKKSEEMLNLFEEMKKRETREAKLYKAIDSLEALIQHNLSDLSTWTSEEYSINLTYANDRVDFSDYLTSLRKEIKKDTVEKIKRENI